MKRLLFSLLLTTGLTAAVNAQTVWNFSDASWTTIDYDASYNGLKFIAGQSALTGFVNQPGSFTDGFNPTRALQFGGNSYGGSTNPGVGVSGTLPTRRYIEIEVSGKVTIKLWGKGGDVGRSLVVTDKATSTVIGNASFSAKNGDEFFTINYTQNASTTLILATGSGDNKLYKIELDYGTMAVNDVRSENKANVFSTGNKIYVTNLESKNTEINVYSTNGQLVKSLKSSANINFDINGQGIFIVNLKSEAGEKSTKVLIK